MKRSTLLMIILAALLVSACTQESGNTQVANTTASAATPAANRAEPPMPYPDVSRISLEQAKALNDAVIAVFIDTHSPSVYAEEHIAAAINIPVSEGVPDVNKIPKG